jgi:hypothetical protein
VGGIVIFLKGENSCLKRRNDISEYNSSICLHMMGVSIGDNKAMIFLSNALNKSSSGDFLS